MKTQELRDNIKRIKEENERQSDALKNTRKEIREFAEKLDLDGRQIQRVEAAVANDYSEQNRCVKQARYAAIQVTFSLVVLLALLIIISQHLL